MHLADAALAPSDYRNGSARFPLVAYNTFRGSACRHIERFPCGHHSTSVNVTLIMCLQQGHWIHVAFNQSPANHSSQSFHHNRPTRSRDGHHPVSPRMLMRTMRSDTQSPCDRTWGMLCTCRSFQLLCSCSPSSLSPVENSRVSGVGCTARLPPIAETGYQYLTVIK